jgi:class 3 adenylate cyclase
MGLAMTQLDFISIHPILGHSRLSLVIAALQSVMTARRHPQDDPRLSWAGTALATAKIKNTLKTGIGVVPHRVSVSRAFVSGARHLARHWALLVVTSLASAGLWVVLKALEHAGAPAAAMGGSLLCGLFALFWFRRALAAASFQPADTGPQRRSWHHTAGRSIGAAVLIIAALTAPTVALAYARLLTQSPVPTPAEAKAAVDWALPIAAALASPVLIRLYLYYAALAAGRRDIGIADAWGWGRGNSLRLLALLAVPVLPLTALAHSMREFALPGVFAGSVVMFVLLALASTLLARALAALVAAPVRVK